MMERLTSPEFITALATLCGALVAAVAALVSLVKSAKLAKALKEAKERETYIVCPHCKKKVHLSEMDFHLPSGELDNNLNGKPDKEEGLE